MEIVLLRHGQTVRHGQFCGSTDVPLSPQGWAQMRAAVDDDLAWDEIVSSPLVRCAAFARELAQRDSIPVRIEPRLAEMGFGEWEGRTCEQLIDEDEAGLRAFWKDPTAFTPPGGEPLVGVQTRVLDAWRQALRAGKERVLVVCHGGPIRIILSRVRRTPLRSLLDFDVPYAARFVVHTEPGAG